MHRDTGVGRDLGRGRLCCDRRIDARYQSSEMMWVDSGDHRLAGGELATIPGSHADRPTGSGRYPLDIHPGEYPAAVLLDATDERARQAAAATHRYPEA